MEAGAADLKVGLQSDTSKTCLLVENGGYRTGPLTAPADE